jgi:predicted transcriptional regulator
MSKTKAARDPRGHSLRIYTDVFDSPAYAGLSPHDVLAYLALLRELKGYNNGDLSLTLTRAKKYGIQHHVTLARSLRALCAVGLVAITRKGGSAKGGQRLPSLYRVTDRECYEIPAKMLCAMKETHEWKRITSVDQARQLIRDAEQGVKRDTEKKPQDTP